MKFVTWNCNGALRKKTHLLDEYDADILVIQECEDPSRSNNEYLDWAGEYLWVGNNKNQGLGVFAKKGAQLKRLDWDAQGLQLFLPCRINNQITLVGVWTKKIKARNYAYIGQLWKYLEIHKSRLEGDKSILCGDFNSNCQWDRPRRSWNHSDVVRELDGVGLRSLYHELNDEEQGQETLPTLFMYRDLEKPYHIDYAFVSNLLGKDLENTFEIGNPAKWLSHSDHMPVIFSIAC